MRSPASALSVLCLWYAVIPIPILVLRCSWQCVVVGADTSAVQVSAPTLARSYHHLFPVDRFVEVKAEPTVGNGSASGEDVVMHRDDPTSCFGCLRPFTDASKLRLRCSKCDNVFCFGCDVFIHDSLHNCPGCCV